MSDSAQPGNPDSTPPGAIATGTCPACGGLVSSQASTCVHCGQPLAGSGPVDRGYPRTSGLAVASLVLAILFPGVGSVLAVIFGHMARSQIRRSQGGETGAGIALAGLILGYLGIVAGIVALVAVLAFWSSGQPIIVR